MDTQIRGDKNNPYHLSVGIVVREGDSVYLVKHPIEGYKLPSETVHLSESIDEAIKRGAQEELGFIVETNRYLGCVISTFTREDETPIEKCTLFFESEVIRNVEKDLEADEIEQQIKQYSIADALALLTEHRPNEAPILTRL
ncbi:NUDIX hydrolase [Candidatus Dojkabacteria bacterium]|uniref:NUDIX hydrolase n=1 Tax=Candidatus Dojkabacteria bacterium TaxID=2099670 RepID=A0A955L4P2_9BACT|nr:NUDIX hydrolase [Candidatus Dojkabacteria bacterium]